MLAQCRAFEEDTILFYEFLQGLLDDEEAAKGLKAIIEEERLHAERLAELAEACA
jgi:rubrerythrin